LVILNVPFGAASKLDIEKDLGPRDFPRVTQAQPFVSEFNLPPLPHCLVEDPKLVTNAITDAWDSQRGQRVEKTGGQTAKSAVAEAGFFLLFQQIVQVESHVLHRRPNLIVNSQVDKVIAQLRPHQELCRKVADRAAPAFEVTARRVDPPMQQTVAHRIRQRHVMIIPGGDGGKAGLQIGQVIAKRASNGCRAEARTNVR